MNPPPLLDYDQAISEPLQRFDDLMARKAEYTLLLIERAEMLEGEAKAKALRTITALEKEIEVLNDMYTTMQNVQKYYEEQLSYFWQKMADDSFRLQFLNDAYLSESEFSKFQTEFILTQLAKK